MGVFEAREHLRIAAREVRIAREIAERDRIECAPVLAALGHVEPWLHTARHEAYIVDRYRRTRRDAS